MRYVFFQSPGALGRRNVQVGVVVDGRCAPLTGIDEFYDDLPNWSAIAAEVTEGQLALESLVLAPPVPRDAKVICAAVNYVAHGREAQVEPPPFPNLFARWTAELVVDGAAVPVPRAEPEGLDWEVELGAILGATATDVDEAGGAQAVFGYTVCNDISGRASQLQATAVTNGQWALGKNVEKSGAVGSFVESADAVNLSDLEIRAVVNGEVMQRANTRDMIFSVGELISFASRHVTLRPGDLFMTGTCEGVGLGRNPRVYMQPGSTVTVSVEGVCSVTNHIVEAKYRG